MVDCTDLDVVREEIPEVYGCPVVGKILAYELPQGTLKTLEHVFRNSAGQAIDLRPCDGVRDSEQSTSSSQSSVSSSGSGDVFDGRVVLRAREILSLNKGNSARHPLYEFEGVVTDAATGVVRVPLDTNISDRAAVFSLSWGLLNEDDVPVLMDESFLFVTRSLFRSDPLHVKGPPTIEEIRLAMRDFAARNLLLGQVEFAGNEIALAVSRPVDEWNNIPPPIASAKYTTYDFPYRNEWLKAICGYLLIAAADTYRRNSLPTSAGGVQVNDQEKEGTYLRRAKDLLDEWRSFIATKKLSINTQGFTGTVEGVHADWGW